MNALLSCIWRISRALLCVLCVLSWLNPGNALANPVGPTVSQGTATFNSQGSQLSIQTSDRALINWQSFNIGVGETTTFMEPSSSSVVWNQIHDSNPSQILGNLNANGYVILQNQSGFYIGGQAVLNTHGLVMTTAPTPAPNLSGSGPWDFNALQPTASIVNYGQINISGGGPAFLIASDIQNRGTISAPQGQIGLYAGQEVLISGRPDGRGLSARVTLPQGSVDNSGNLIADAGKIAMQAQVVNQGGLVEANSVREVNGVIELVASDSLNLGAGSLLSARGDSAQGNSSTPVASPGGFVVLKSGGTFIDTPTSAINVAGQLQGPDGVVEVLSGGAGPATVNSQIDGKSATEFQASGGLLFNNPGDLTLSYAPTTTGAANPNVDLTDLSSYTKISLFAHGNIHLTSGWNLPDSSDPSARLSLDAGNSIILDDATYIAAGNNWDINLTAGPANLTSRPASGMDGVYLNGNQIFGSFIQTQNGDINVWAANEVQMEDTPVPNTPLLNGIRTLAGGSIQVKAEFGDVNTGANSSGYFFQNASPFYTVSSSVGGISTAAGGDVTITAGGNVHSYLPISTGGDSGQDAGTGAFGPEPGNVTISAGGSVYGHFVLANGSGTITALANIGGYTLGDNVSLSLIKGSWTLNAPNGDIYLQEVRNPDGVFNDTHLPRSSTGVNPSHLFDYDPQASVTLNAGNEVLLLPTLANLPRSAGSVPVLFPPSLYINAGAGGVYLADAVILFPSAFGELHITTTAGGGLAGSAANGSPVQLLMSDSASKNYTGANGPGSFQASDYGPVPQEINNPNAVVLNISGSINNMALVTDKETHITVGGDLVNSSFSGQNLHTSDKTTIVVGGQIYNSPSFASVVLHQPPTQVAAQDLPLLSDDVFDELLRLAVYPDKAAATFVLANATTSDVLGDWVDVLQFGRSTGLGQTTGFRYDPASGRLSLLGAMADNQQLLNILAQQTITVVRFTQDANGNRYPVVDTSGHFVTDTYPAWVDAADLASLLAASAAASRSINHGLRIGGPGEFDIQAGSISLGDSFGILSCGALDYGEGGLGRYANLAAITPVGAALNVASDGNIEMLTSTMASLAGGNVTIQSVGGEIDLGTPYAVSSFRNLPFGAFVTGSGPSGPGTINVWAYKDVNIEGSRIAAYDGGTATVTSDTGNVDAGSGGATAALVETHYVDPISGAAERYTAGVYGSGILAVTLVDPGMVPGAPVLPGDITVTTPQGNIYASRGGILQEALNGNLSGGPTVTLVAGTSPTPENGNTSYKGNIDLGDSGVIGGTLNLTANGNIAGLVISRQSSVVNAALNFNGTVLAGGSANVSAAGNVSGTIVGITGASVSGGSGVTAQVLSQNATVNGGTATSTLGAAAAASSTSTAAAATASTDTREQTLGPAATSQKDDDLNKRNKLPMLAKRTGRVRVILPN